MTKIKIAALSDLHGNLINIKESFDIMFICGDILPLEKQKGFRAENWINTAFRYWIEALPFNDEHSKVIVIPGNHDFLFEALQNTEIKKWVDSFKDNRLVYLNNEQYDFKLDNRILKIFGCPWCRELKGWAFCRNNLPKYYEFIPDGMDVLLLHDAPDILNGGMSTEGKNKNNNFGNPILAKYVDERKPKYCFFGHIHTSLIKTPTLHNCTILCNVSILDEDYKVRFKPLYITI